MRLYSTLQRGLVDLPEPGAGGCMTLPPDVLAKVQRILDVAARRILDERLRADQPAKAEAEEMAA